MNLDAAASNSHRFYSDLYYFLLLKRFHLTAGLHKESHNSALKTDVESSAVRCSDAAEFD